MSRRLLLAAFGLSLAVSACNDDDNPAAPRGPGRTLQLQFTGLPALGGGFHYEGWAIIGGQPVSTGKFNVDEGRGRVTRIDGAPIADGAFGTDIDLGGASAIVITIEPAGDNDTVPAATKILAGMLSGAAAPLSIGAPQALGTDFGGASGAFILATPTDGEGNNETSGLWFLDLRTGSPMPSLSLPALPAGWQYEGWAVINGRPVTTGRFSAGSGADMSAPFSGPLPAPPFPGEDFLRNAPAGLSFPTDLRGGMAVISVEPSPDDSPAPFALKPLVATIAPGAADHVTFMMSRSADVPRGTATVR